MDVQVAENGPCSRTLTIRIPPERIRSQLDLMFNAASGQVQMKGFRNGQVPRKLIEKRLGKTIRADAKERIVTDIFNEVRREHKLDIVGRPRIEGIDNSPVDEHQTLEFTVHLSIRPKFELPELDSLELKAEPTAVVDGDVETALTQLADQKKTLEPVDSPVDDGDFFGAELRYLDEAGKEVLTRSGLKLNTGIALAGTDPDAFRASVTGLATGATAKVAIEFPATFEVEAVRGKPGTVEVKVGDVQRVTPPPIDDEFAKGYDHDDLEALRATLHRRIGEEKERAELIRRENHILEQLLERTPFEPPTELVDDQVEHDLTRFKAQLEEQQVPEADIQARIDAARPEARTGSERRIRMFFLLEAVALKAGIGVADDDVRQQFQAIAQANQVTADQVQKYLVENNLVSDLRVQIMERKVRDHLRETVPLKEATA